MLRNRAKQVSLKTVKQLDAFPKVPESYTETSPVGGTLSLLSCVVIVWLVISEISYFLDSRFKFQFVPDTDFDTKLKINVDITVAMPCGIVGADILDSTSQNLFKFGVLEEEDTWFELTDQQRIHFDSVKNVNSYLREEFHALQDLLWKSGYSTMFGDMPPRQEQPNTSPDACRIYGTLILNKVAGNFHITAGKSLALPRGHVHISAFMTEGDYNFSHRINRFSFGDPSPGIIYPLEGDEKITTEHTMLYQYFVEVVPTEVNTFLTRLLTYQYSAKEHQRPVDHNQGSHGVPGIFFKYDVSALKVKVTEERDTIWQFLVRLCATVGGIYVTSGILNSLMQLVVNTVKGKYVTPKVAEKETGNISSRSLLSAGDSGTGNNSQPISLVSENNFNTNCKGPLPVHEHLENDYSTVVQPSVSKD